MAQNQIPGNTGLPARVRNADDLRGLLKKYQGQFAAVLPKALPVDRLMRMALYAVTVNPKLLECDPKSFLRSVLLAGSFGLEAGGPKAHLVPFWNSRFKRYDCQLIIDYKGLVELARRSGQISNIISRIVYEKEPFEIDESMEYPYKHKQLPPSKRGEKKVGAYAVAKGKDGRVIGNDFMWAEEIEAIKERSLGQKKNTADNPWVKYEEEMWKKSPIRRLAKMLPQEPELQRAAIIEEAREAGIVNSTPMEVDLGLAEEDSPPDVQGKTEQKTDGLVEKLGGGSEQGSAGGEQTGASVQTGNETQTGGAGQGTQESAAQTAAAQTPPTPDPAASLPLDGKKKRKAGSVVKQDENAETQNLQMLVPEEGKSRADYIFKDDPEQFRCPPKGDKEGYIIHVNYCRNMCDFFGKGLCFVHNTES